LYSKSMSIIGQVRINNVISANTDDMLGAFVNNQCRGVGRVTYYPQLDRYLLFMDVYGVNENEAIEFRIWNSATGKTHVEVEPALNFVNNNLVGTVNTPQIFNARDKVYQEIVLRTGWNWISFNLLMADSNNLGKLFANLSLTNEAIIKNNVELAVYDQVQGWSGNLANFNVGIKPEKSYLFYVTANDTIITKGVEANPVFRPIPMVQGWNYIGFVGQRNLSLNEAFANFNPKHNDLIKGQIQFAVYDSLLGWIGSMQVLSPGRGYQYFSHAAGTLLYPRSAMFGKTNSNENLVQSKYWSYNANKFESNMNLIASIDVCSELQAKGDLLLGAFVGDELRGLAKAQLVSPNNYAYFLNIGGNNKEEITFKLLDESTTTVYPLNGLLSFEPNLLKGSLVQPVTLGMDVKIECNNKTDIRMAISAEIFPVPTRSNITAKVSLPNEENIVIKIYDLSGKELMVEHKGNFAKGNYEWPIPTETLADGIYIVEIATQKQSMRFKMIKNE